MDDLGRACASGLNSADFVAHFQAHITQVVDIQVCLASSAIFKSLICLIAHLVENGRNSIKCQIKCGIKAPEFGVLGQALGMVQP